MKTAGTVRDRGVLKRVACESNSARRVGRRRAGTGQTAVTFCHPIPISLSEGHPDWSEAAHLNGVERMNSDKFTVMANAPIGALHVIGRGP